MDINHPFPSPLGSMDKSVGGTHLPMGSERMPMMNHAITVVGMFAHLQRCSHLRPESGDVPQETLELSKAERMAYHAALNYLTQEFGKGYRDFEIPIMGTPLVEESEEDTCCDHEPVEA